MTLGTVMIFRYKTKDKILKNNKKLASLNTDQKGRKQATHWGKMFANVYLKKECYPKYTKTS